MRLIAFQKIKNKNIRKLLDNFDEEDDNEDANGSYGSGTRVGANKANEVVLNKEINKIITAKKKMQPKPIDTRLLVKK